MQYLVEYQRDDGSTFYMPLKHTADEFKWLLEMVVGYDFNCAEDYVGTEFTFKIVAMADGFYESLDNDM